MKPWVPVLLLLAGYFNSNRALAWDYTGHMLVDQIAYEQLKPDVRDRVSKLVGSLENKYNDHHPYNFITAGAWLDDMRSDPHYAYSKLHYIDLPYTFSGVPFTEPDPPHAWSGLDQAIAILKDVKAPDQQRSEAVAMVMHLVGDIHQPLHCVDWNDRGGNGYLVSGIPFSDVSKKSTPNLHSFWDRAFRFDVKDGKIVELYFGFWTSERPESPDNGRLHDEAAKIMAQFPKPSLPKVRSTSPRTWAMESYTIACLFAYPVRPHPADTEVVTLSNDYVQHAHEIACERIALAGYRLAALLQEIFTK